MCRRPIGFSADKMRPVRRVLCSGLWLAHGKRHSLTGKTLMAHPSAARDTFGGSTVRSRSVVMEGMVAGVIGATSVALWFLIVDLIRGRAFLVPAALGHGLLHATGLAGTDSFATNVLAYTAFHYAAFLLVGVVAALILRRADTQPSVLAGAFLLFIVFEVGFFVLTAIIPRPPGFGLPSWLLISIGNIIAAVTMGAYLWRSHPLLTRHLDRALSGRDGTER